ncbi:MAG TPA: hypothetical protein DIV86_03690, partial [Alphaproteobacteria bacterium]|nr:hypothetical protein [Alphaproteobacteria bacterium]
MIKSLKLRTFLFGFAVSLILFSLFFILHYKTTIENYNKTFLSSAIKLSSARSDFIAVHLWNLNNEEISTISKNLLTDPTFCGIKIIDENKGIYFQNGRFENSDIKINPQPIIETDYNIYVRSDINYKLGDELKKIGEAIFCFTKKQQIIET